LNTGKEYILVKNKTAATVQMTITAPGADEYGELANVVITGIAGSTTPYNWHVFGPFSTKHFNDADGYVKVTFDVITNVEVAVFKFGQVYE
jgi:hypothetical protein